MSPADCSPSSSWHPVSLYIIYITRIYVGLSKSTQTSVCVDGSIMKVTNTSVYSILRRDTGRFGTGHFLEFSLTLHLWH